MQVNITNITELNIERNRCIDVLNYLSAVQLVAAKQNNQNALNETNLEIQYIRNLLLQLKEIRLQFLVEINSKKPIQNKYFKLISLN